MRYETLISSYLYNHRVCIDKSWKDKSANENLSQNFDKIIRYQALNLKKFRPLITISLLINVTKSPQILRRQVSTISHTLCGFLKVIIVF